MPHRKVRAGILGFVSLLIGQVATVGLAEAADRPEELPTTAVQVLLQGPDQKTLRDVLLAHGGHVTHELPIVNGIGGEVQPDQLNSLYEALGVSRVTEDYNPPHLPDERDCVIAGDLFVELTGSDLTWRIHNFSDQPQALESIEGRWPDQLQDARLEIGVQPDGDAVVVETLRSGHKTGLNHVLPPGPSLLRFTFSQSLEALNQNDFSLNLGSVACETALVPAYPGAGAGAGAGGDYYYPSEAGTTLLSQAGITGSGIGVAIIDSGMWDVAALTRNTAGENRVLAHYDAIGDSLATDLKDPGGHGSHMASIIANSNPVSRPDGNGHLGIAPDANLIPVTAISPRGDGDFMDIIRGIQWVIANKESLNIRVLNLSLTATPRAEYWKDPMNQAVMKAWEAGITVVVAAGNDGDEWGTIGSPGNNPYVITVGAFTDSWTPKDQRDDYIPDFSSRGPTPEGFIKPDLVAPGGHIAGLIPPESTLARDNPNYFLPTGEFVSTGSSQAAAVVSGLIALLLEVKPELTNDDVKCLLITSAQPALSRDGRLAYSPFIQGNGRVDGARALTVGDVDCDQKSLDVGAALTGRETLYGPAEMLPDGSPTLPGYATMVQDTPANSGFSDDRRWGVAAHLQRLDAATEAPQAEDVPFDWAAVFRVEQQKLNALKAGATDIQAFESKE